ncbi:MAG: tryptophan 2,3-dioxygenase family protein [Candidatus Kapabacteria bacterium]|nr:tryptophan 2,3-dioxygenase family protein [Candidatus Kapabacteria bacterium]
MERKYSSVHYSDYLELDRVLTSQNLRSVELGNPAHDEMLFIIIHQVYELWFKQILHELDSVLDNFHTIEDDETIVGIAIARLNRVTEIQKVMIEQIRVLDTMTPLDFLDFRNYLIPASGFQSFQFRLVEIKLGLRPHTRLTYNDKSYNVVFTEERQKMLKDLETTKSLFDLVEGWLERTPFLEFENFNFKEQYLIAVDKMVERERQAIEQTEYLPDDAKLIRLRMLNESKAYIESSMDEEKHNELVKNGEVRLSYKATIAALLINLYRDEPILRGPYNLLNKISEMDEQFTMWRHRHSQMVMRMIGRKMGTGGSSGYEYLKKTAEQHQIFKDLHNISTLMIPRSDLPILPEILKEKLNFAFKAGQ